MPEDLAKSDLDTLAGILDEIKDPEFRARVADVLWVSRKDYKAAQKSVEAYIESSRALETGDMWPPFAERLQRAMQMGAQLGWSKPFHPCVSGLLTFRRCCGSQTRAPERASVRRSTSNQCECQ